MTVDEITRHDLEKAKQLIQAKKYEDARAILLTIDHATADKWLARLNEMSASKPTSKVQVPVVLLPSFTNKLMITVVLLFLLVIPGLIALTVFSREAKAAQLAAGQKLPGADALINLNKYLFWIILEFLVLIVIFFVLAYILSDRLIGV